MLKIYTFLVVSVLFMTSVVSAQRSAIGKSLPGRLGKKIVSVKDTQPPTINLTEITGLVTQGSEMRGIKVVPKTTIVTIRGAITDNQTVASLKINGKNIQLRGTSSRKEFAVKLKPPTEGRTKNIKFAAYDSSGNISRKNYQITRPSASSPPVLELIKTELGPVVPPPNPPPTDDTTPSSGQYWALIIGIKDYPHPSLNNLTYSVNDAVEVADVLTKKYTFDPERVKTLINPTRAKLIGAFSDYTPEGTMSLGEKDNLLIFYAGHGYWDENYREGYWLPSDAEQQNRANWVSNSDVQRACRAIQAKHILLLSDACFSGSMFVTRKPFSRAFGEAYKERSRRAITAGNLTEVPDISVFKEYLVKYLVENTELYLDAGSLYNKLKEPVTNNSLTGQTPIYGVIQQTGDEGGEFIFVRRK